MSTERETEISSENEAKTGCWKQNLKSVPLSHTFMPTTKLPLFVLGPDFMPMSSASLRVFEPRYKQMMDDCILDSKPFGYITYDPDTEDIGGWTQPAKYGVLVEIEDYQESGSNIMINIISGRRFKSTQVIQPVLDNDVSGTHFPAVDELMEKADNPACLLYTSPSPRDKRQSRMPSSA